MARCVVETHRATGVFGLYDADLTISDVRLIRYNGVRVSEEMMREVLEGYERLRADHEEWQSYLDEIAEFERAALSDLRDRLAADEGPEGPDWGDIIPPAQDG